MGPPIKAKHGFLLQWGKGYIVFVFQVGFTCLSDYLTYTWVKDDQVSFNDEVIQVLLLSFCVSEFTCVARGVCIGVSVCVCMSSVEVHVLTLFSLHSSRCM